MFVYFFWIALTITFSKSVWFIIWINNLNIERFWNSINFSKSNGFTESNYFSISNQFSESNEFTQTQKFSPSYHFKYCCRWSVEDFISYINRKNIPLYSEIAPSIFETNSFLIDNKNTTLIEYSAFFGSIQIFQYLLMNNVELTPSLWLYSIHSKNAELVHLLESNEVQPPEDSNNYFIQCLIEAIKCHHNDFADYIESNLLVQNQKNKSKQNEQIISNCLKYHNYIYIRADNIFDHAFFYLCQYDYNTLINFLLKSKEDEIESRLISKLKIF